MTMFAYDTLTEMGQLDKIRACYQDSCLSYVKREYMTNTTLRNRLGIEEKNYPISSKILKQTQEKGLIKITKKSKVSSIFGIRDERCRSYLSLIYLSEDYFSCF